MFVGYVALISSGVVSAVLGCVFPMYKAEGTPKPSKF
jgi:hypothetical protein